MRQTIPMKNSLLEILQQKVSEKTIRMYLIYTH